MNSGILLIVSLYVRPGHETEFREFEAQAAHIIAQHGGRMLHVIRPIESLPAEPLPHEVHVVSFPSIADLDSYRNDADLAALAPLREAAIAKTTVVLGREGEPYL